jgi:hypothetical protein
MKFLTSVYDRNRAGEILGVLRDKGIPAFTKVAGSPWVAPYQIAIFVCIDAQYEDASAVLRNPEHLVKMPVDVAEFEELAKKQDVMPLIKWGVILGLVMIIVVTLVGYFLGVPLFGNSQAIE